MLITDQRISPLFFVFFYVLIQLVYVRMLYFSVKLAEKKAVVDKRKKQKPTGFWGIWLFEISVKSEIIKTLRPQILLPNEREDFFFGSKSLSLKA